MGFFKPAWMGSDREKALQTVDALIDQTILARAAREAYSDEVRSAAVRKLTNKDILNEVINDEKLSNEVKLEAERRLEILERALKQEQAKTRDSEILLTIEGVVDPDEGRAVFRQIFDENKRLQALYKIHEPRVISAVLQHEINYGGKMRKANVREAIKNAIERIGDQNAIIDLFENSRSFCVRDLAMELIMDQSVVVRALYNYEDRLEKEYMKYSQKEEIALLCSAIVGRVTDIEYLSDIAKRSSFYENRMAAMNKLTESGIMIDYVLPVRRVKSVNEYGNSAGNINNGGYAAVQEDWIYYSNRKEMGFMYKIRVDGADREQIGNDTCSYINVIDEWVYYRNESEKNHLYKIRINGTGRTRLNGDGSSNIIVIGDWIFYKNNSDHNSIYRIRTDGTNEMKLYGISDCHYFTVTGDSVYFTATDNRALFKAHTDGSDITCVHNNCSGVNIIGDWMYYLSQNESAHQINKCRTDGTGEMRITSDDCQCLNAAGDWIYYRNQSDRESSCLYKIRTNGAGKTKLNNDATFDINLAGNWIYYKNRDDDNRLYRVRTNGTERQIVI